MAGKRVPVRPVAEGRRQVRAESRKAPRESAFSGCKSLIFAAPGHRDGGPGANFAVGLMESRRPRQRRKRIPGVIPARATRVLPPPGRRTGEESRSSNCVEGYVLQRPVSRGAVTSSTPTHTKIRIPPFLEEIGVSGQRPQGCPNV